jgi:pyrroline-5-carboxylate reductase
MTKKASFHKFLFIGAGNMGGAILRGLSKSGHPSNHLFFYEPNDAVASQVAADTQAIRAQTTDGACAQADVMVLCVKPQIFASAALPLRESLERSPKRPLVVSIMAGVTKAKVMEALGLESGVIRVMPNIALTAGKGTVAIASDGASKEELDLAESVFASCGSCVRVGEAQMDAVSGLSGSGPAFVFQFAEGLAMGGVQAGLPYPVAMELALSTIEGSVAMLKNGAPGPLTSMVTSPAGTTVAGLAELEKSAFRGAVMNAVRAAAERSRQLG